MQNNPIDPNMNTQRDSHHHEHQGSAWWALILILIGVILLVQNLHIASFTFHWWALFIFIPVIGSLSNAWSLMQREGGFSAKARGSLGSAVVVGTVGVLLMFGMDWSRYWPAVLIAVGFSMFLMGVGGAQGLIKDQLSALARLGAWTGIATMLLGLGFWAIYLPIPVLQSYLTLTGTHAWWAIPILVVSLGALINTFLISRDNDWQMNWAAWSMLLIAVFIGAVGVFAFLSVNWNLLFPIVVIACGLAILAGFFTRK